ncbi:DsbA family oxidoreductase [Candidatus Nitrotoga sp. M5]|uniref:DsbA family oxidoreductase n=1 Tax=Candidatus Nitrotoga sp. M5 TaxID=2890409 RepID=UPI001EF2F529|nr:DsbA family oxidoreductase [Candidatus Nitrotoga sp. M5]CAH1385355.1 Predicted dithiol-disulfide isomerase, DsbA family [Candidatus Nitrotoga sp. M5]
MNKKIKLDIVSDVVCPWCIVGYKHLEAAINELGLQDRVEIEWQSFELNPDMPEQGENLRAHVQRKYGAERDESDKARANISALGAKYGFEFDYFEEMKMVNTRDAHLLLDFAHEKGMQHQLMLRLFASFFSEHKDVSVRAVLLAEAQSVGLDPAVAALALDDAERRNRVLNQESQWQQQGISGVPTVIFNHSSAMTGAHPQSAYKEVLQKLAGL